MNNIKLFFSNSGLNVSLLFDYLIKNQLFVGVCVGFLISTAIHFVITLGGVKDIAHVLTKSPEDSYKLVMSPNPESADHTNFARFKRIHASTRIMVFVGLLLVVLMCLYFALN